MRALHSGFLLVLVSACTLVAEKEEPPPFDPGPEYELAPVWAPPADWATMPAFDFERMVERDLPEGKITPIREDARRELGEALERLDPTSVRAAVILGRSRHDESALILLGQLKKRLLGPERGSDAGDVVAAAALARFPQPERFWRVVRMSEDKNPHPDLEVRVECACTALSMGIDRVIPFLLEVLRIDTWEGLADRRAFPTSTTTTWARTRAAQALSERAGVPLTYRADASIAARERETRRLEELLLVRGEDAGE